MSLDDLRADLKRNMSEAKRLAPTGAPGVHLHETLWPFLEAIVDVLEEVDDAVAEMVDRTEDYLQAETAAIFAALVQSSLLLSDELRKRAAGDELLLKRLAAHDELCGQAMATLGEITMIAPDGDEEEEKAGDADA
jgi:uncharacterized protein YydD (DUF2326 family)